jgi:hypothetical protein
MATSLMGHCFYWAGACLGLAEGGAAVALQLLGAMPVLGALIKALQVSGPRRRAWGPRQAQAGAAVQGGGGG